MGALLVQRLFLAALGLLLCGWEQSAVPVCVQVLLELFRVLLPNPKNQLCFQQKMGVTVLCDPPPLSPVWLRLGELLLFWPVPVVRVQLAFGCCACLGGS